MYQPSRVIPQMDKRGPKSRCGSLEGAGFFHHTPQVYTVWETAAWGTEAVGNCNKALYHTGARGSTYLPSETCILPNTSLKYC